MQSKDRTTNEHTVFLGKTADFEGKLKFFGSTRIEGCYKGNISGEGVLEVAEDSRIEADVHANQISVLGEVRGNIFAEEKIEIKSTARIFGKIEAPIVIMEAGAVFQGKCRNQKPEIQEKEEYKIKSSVRPKSSGPVGPHE